MKDPTPMQNTATGDGIWQADSIEMFVGSENLTTGGAFQFSDRQVLLSAQKGADGYHWYFNNAPKQFDVKMVTVRNVAGDGYTLEAAIPFAGLGFKPRENQEFCSTSASTIRQPDDASSCGTAALATPATAAPGVARAWSSRRQAPLSSTRFSNTRTLQRCAVNSKVARAVLSILPVFGSTLTIMPSFTCREIVEIISRSLNAAPHSEGADTFKMGDAQTPVTRVAVTMLPTLEVLQKAVAQGCNFVIAHEPLFYGHHDATDELERENDAVWKFKRDFIESHKLVVWRFHDLMHSVQPDMITFGMAEGLGWLDFQNPKNEQLFRFAADNVGRFGAATPRQAENLQLCAWWAMRIGLSRKLRFRRAVRLLKAIAIRCKTPKSKWWCWAKRANGKPFPTPPTPPAPECAKR